MRFRLLAVGQKMPDWVNQGFYQYQKRLPKDFALELIEIPSPSRQKSSNIDQLMEKEAAALLAKVTPQEWLVALDVQGQRISTEQFSEKATAWRLNGQTVSFCIGGPDGLHSQCLNRANERWSLSALTYPHPLVRIIFAEQLYRVWSILNRHPYHR